MSHMGNPRPEPALPTTTDVLWYAALFLSRHHHRSTVVRCSSSFHDPAEVSLSRSHGRGMRSSRSSWRR
ncbi:unnamed protein product [Calypogeia fissa]